MAVSSGDFKQCGIIMGMSIMQGGPAPNFMDHGVSCFLTGCKLSTSLIENQGYKEIVASVSYWEYVVIFIVTQFELAVSNLQFPHC